VALLKKIRLGLRIPFAIRNWPTFLLDYLGLKKGYLVYSIGDKKVKVRAHSIDKKILIELVLDDKYFPKWFSLEKDATVVDVGAHIGIFSVLVGRKVYSIEPSKENYDLLLEQTKLNNSNIIPFNIALSDKNETVKLYNGRHSARCSIIRKETSEWESVNTLTMKDFFERNKIEKCDLLKMDVEGAEYKILKSTPKEIFKKIQNIFIEIHDVEGENRQELIEFIKSQGYDIKIKDDFVYAVRPSPPKN